MQNRNLIVPGKRLLFRTQQDNTRLQEGVVEEFSPSKNHVRIGKDWHAVDHVQPIEDLPVAKLKATKADVLGQPELGDKGKEGQEGKGEPKK